LLVCMQTQVFFLFEVGACVCSLTDSRHSPLFRTTRTPPLS
jgi:hypothetical protein